jgi:ABC-2 type transport system permease protein
MAAMMETTTMRVNWIGLRTLYVRESWRFLKVWNQTIIAPVVTTLLFLAILTLALGREGRLIDGIPYEVFVAPGLIMMAVVQNAFANTSSSLMISKFQGVIIDILMPPLSAAEVTFAMVAGGVTRGILVGISVSLAMSLFVPIHVHDWGMAIAFIVLACIMLALFGMLAGVFAITFDHVAALTNYVITPLAFLSGTFYSIKSLPGIWYEISHYNPFFYMIDGFRYALTGYSDADPYTGLLVLTSTAIVLWAVVQTLYARGWRLKS